MNNLKNNSLIDLFGNYIWSGIYNQKWNIRFAAADAVYKFSKSF